MATKRRDTHAETKEKERKERRRIRGGEEKKTVLLTSSLIVTYSLERAETSDDRGYSLL